MAVCTLVEESYHSTASALQPRRPQVTSHAAEREQALLGEIVRALDKADLELAEAHVAAEGADSAGAGSAGAGCDDSDRVMIYGS